MNKKVGSDIEIAREAKMKPVREVAAKLGIPDEHLLPYGHTKAKISMEEAKKAALAIHAGEVLETEYAIESDGSISYEFDIKTASGKEMEVEIDAVTGKLDEEPEEEEEGVDEDHDDFAY